jgi:hypothetical protein
MPDCPTSITSHEKTTQSADTPHHPRTTNHMVSTHLQAHFYRPHGIHKEKYHPSCCAH